MKNRTKQRILSVVLSILMCLWLMSPADVWGAAPPTPLIATASNPELLNGTGAEAADGFTRTEQLLTITGNDNWTVVYRAAESPLKLSAAAGFQGSITVRTLDADTDELLTEDVYVFDGTSGTVTFTDAGIKDKTPLLTDDQQAAVPVWRVEQPADITALVLDNNDYTLPALSGKTSLYLVPSLKNHTLSVTRKDSEPETTELNWDGKTFLLQKQQTNAWTVLPAIAGWTFGETPSVPSGTAKFGTPVFTYSAARDGSYTQTPPSAAGTWYLKAEITETADYTGLMEIVSFEVAPGSSTVVITNDSLDKTYDGLPAADPEVQKTGSTKEIQIRWEQKNGSEWTVLTEAPASAGEYKVTAYLEADSGYGSASAEKTFTITTAENSWTQAPAISDFTYGSEPAPSAAAAFGTPIFTYSSTKDGTYGELPADAPAGTWYLKTEVPATDNYSGLSEITEFRITKAAAPELTLPENLTAVQDAPLSTVALPDGWTWADPEQNATVSNSGYPARFAVDDQNYDYTSVDGYHADGHYVERTLTVTVAAGKNTWTEGLSIEDWIYGQTPSVPNAKAEHGTVTFTYSADPDGTFTDKVPDQAGIWYVRAYADGGSEYESLTLTEQFLIRKAVPAPEFPELKATYGQTLNDLKLPEGFSFADPSVSVGTVGTRSFSAVYTPKDTANYEVLTGISLSVTVQKAENRFTEAPALKGWTYGSKANTPTAKTAFGTPYFLYSQKAHGTYSASVPSTAGTWYLKAVTDGTENYKAIASDPVSFLIEPKPYEEKGSITIPNIDSSTDLSKLTVKDGDTILKQGTDYEIEKTLKDKTMSVTITFKGNYKGTVVRTYTATDEEIKAWQEAQRKKSVQTGDENMTEFWAVLSILSLSVLLILICVLRIRKRTGNLNDF